MPYTPRTREGEKQTIENNGQFPAGDSDAESARRVKDRCVHGERYCDEAGKCVAVASEDDSKGYCPKGHRKCPDKICWKDKTPNYADGQKARTKRDEEAVARATEDRVGTVPARRKASATATEKKRAASRKTMRAERDAIREENRPRKTQKQMTRKRRKEDNAAKTAASNAATPYTAEGRAELNKTAVANQKARLAAEKAQFAEEAAARKAATDKRMEQIRTNAEKDWDDEVLKNRRSREQGLFTPALPSKEAWIRQKIDKLSQQRRRRGGGKRSKGAKTKKGRKSRKRRRKRSQKKRSKRSR